MKVINSKVQVITSVGLIETQSQTPCRRDEEVQTGAEIKHVSEVSFRQGCVIVYVTTRDCLSEQSILWEVLVTNTRLWVFSYPLRLASYTLMSLFIP
jgi:hypothetical protein